MRMFCVTAILTIAISAQLHAEEAGREQVGEVLGKPVYRDQFQSAKGHSNRCDAIRGLFIGPLWERLRAEHAESLNVSEEEIQAFVKHHERQLAKEKSDAQEELKQVEAKLAHSGLDENASQDLKDRKAELAYVLQCLGKQAEEKRKAEREFDAQNQQVEESLPWYLRAIVVELHRPRNGVSRFDRSEANFVISNWKEEHFLYKKYGGGELLDHRFGVEALDARRKWIEERESKGDFKVTDAKVRKMLYDYWTTQLETCQANEDFLRPAWRRQLEEDLPVANAPFIDRK